MPRSKLPATKKKAPRRIGSIAVGFRIIRALEAANGPRALKEIAAAANMTPSKAYLYLATFVHEGLVRQDPTTGHYGFGPTAVQLGFAAIQTMDLVRLAQEELDYLHRRTECAAYLSLWGNRGPVIISKIDGDWQGALVVRIGYVLPLMRSSTGQVFLAFLPPSETESVLAWEQAMMRMQRSVHDAALSHKDPAEVREEVRRAGYAESQNQLNASFLSFSVPIFDYSERIVGALTVLGPKTLLSKTVHRKVIDHLQESSVRLSTQLGRGSSQAPTAKTASKA